MSAAADGFHSGTSRQLYLFGHQHVNLPITYDWFDAAFRELAEQWSTHRSSKTTTEQAL